MTPLSQSAGQWLSWVLVGFMTIVGYVITEQKNAEIVKGDLATAVSSKIVADEDGKIVSITDAALRTLKKLGYTKQGLLDQDIDTLFDEKSAIHDVIANMKPGKRQMVVCDAVTQDHRVVTPVVVEFELVPIEDGKTFLVAANLTLRENFEQIEVVTKP